MASRISDRSIRQELLPSKCTENKPMRFSGTTVLTATSDRPISVQSVVHVHGFAHLLERRNGFLAGPLHALAQHPLDVSWVRGVARAALTDGREVVVERIREQGLQLATAAITLSEVQVFHADERSS